jgi:hypothetical protein
MATVDGKTINIKLQRELHTSNTSVDASDVTMALIKKIQRLYPTYMVTVGYE